MDVRRGVRREGYTQALGLTLLAGLPLYACGRLLSAISMVWIADGRPMGGAVAALGAALGVLVTGLSGLSRLGAPSLLLFLLIVLSGTALLQGSMLEGLEEVHAAGGDGLPGSEVGMGSKSEMESKPESEMEPS